ncbi:uncharacterized protein LOC117174797 isoform X1 [Belonocnema kinseyi]|uniref:uncharacterized protein LOC117174797 isoform X1 n=1 Tax=Belonocnema kinseyi TaxID=2817044 RepID=UPI00143D7423|nr:uncharacterized protein LOC117174797 isoform X1 [Belonocnema kinseyi]XP_033220057.1 uncharacterized protein LOC117174797 isoform X1 [Belonocnema kinseyi]
MFELMQGVINELREEAGETQQQQTLEGLPPRELRKLAGRGNLNLIGRMEPIALPASPPASGGSGTLSGSRRAEGHFPTAATGPGKRRRTLGAGRNGPRPVAQVHRPSRTLLTLVDLQQGQPGWTTN